MVAREAERGQAALMPAPARLLVNIDVDDLASGEAFYTTVFGVKPIRRAWMETIPAGTPLMLKRPSSPDCPPTGVPTTCTPTQIRQWLRRWPLE